MTARTIDANGVDITSLTPVTLGEKVWIGVTSTDAALGTNFYLSDCTATNGEDATIPGATANDPAVDNPDYKKLQLVDGGCIRDVLTEIAPAMSGQSLVFNQFAFADSSQSKIQYLIAYPFTDL